MAFKVATNIKSSKQKSLTIVLLYSLALALFVLTISFKPTRQLLNLNIYSCQKQHLYNHLLARKNETKNPTWYKIIENEVNDKLVNIGLVNFDNGMNYEYDLKGHARIVNVKFNRVRKNLDWKKFFPAWIDEDEKWNKATCPEIPMPRSKKYRDLDVIVARVPCGSGGDNEGIRDIFRLQVNLVVANLVLRSGVRNRTVHAVFVGSCGPMVEIFRCDELVRQAGDYRVYRPGLKRLFQKLLMPVGTCQLAPPYAVAGKERWREYMAKSTPNSVNSTIVSQREAYVTVLHSSENYVCGAISLAYSIRRTGSTKDLILLADDSITNKSLAGLTAAGWKIKRIHRIRSPFATKGSYNEWNYSKLRIWQLVEYDKVIFIDSDLIVRKNLDEFFNYPELSAARNDKVIFNSGIMVIEPSNCMFEDMMLKSSKIKPYNGGDQGFLNEIFTWWHRLPSKINFLKSFNSIPGDNHEIKDDNIWAMHFIGYKPWTCYRDYDCNWDDFEHNVFASDSATKLWWDLHDDMPKELQSYCGLSKKMDAVLRNRRERAQRENLENGHWRIAVKDSRRLHDVQ